MQHAEDESDDADHDLEWAERADQASAGFAADAIIEEEQTSDNGEQSGEDGGLPLELESTYV